MPELPAMLANTIARYRHVLLATTVVSAIALPQIVNALDASAEGGRIIVAQKEDPKKKKEQQPQPKPQPKVVQPPPQQQPKPQPKVVQPPPQQQPKPQPKIVQPPPQQQPKPQPKIVQPPPQQQPKPQPKVVQPPPQQQPKPQPKVVQPPQQQPQPKVVQPPTKQPQPKVVQPPTTQPQPKVVQPPQQKTQPKVVQPPTTSPTTPQAIQQPQPKVGPKQFDPKGTPQTAQPKLPPPKAEFQTFGKPKPPAGPQVVNVNQLKNERQVITKGNTVVIREPGNRLIIRENNRIVIRHDESERMRRWGNARFELRGQERYTIVNRGSYDIVTVTDANGRLLRRYRRGLDGREYVLIDNRRRLAIGAAVVGGVVLLGLAAPRITIPRERYVVGVETAPPVLLYETLDAPPVAPLARAYSLDEIRDNVELRDHVRSVDINTINFATGSWEISPDQVPQLQALAEAMLRVIGENSSTVFMLEGHTDAVGSAEDNLSLSDRRAEAVAEILTTHFNVPPENLVTQGYGEQHLKVPTQGPSRENRRVVVRNITGLMAGQGEGGDGGVPGGPPG